MNFILICVEVELELELEIEVEIELDLDINLRAAGFEITVLKLHRIDNKKERKNVGSLNST